MPNQRKEGKAMIGAWIPQELADDLKAISRDRFMPMSTLLEEIIRKKVDDEKRKGFRRRSS